MPVPLQLQAGVHWWCSCALSCHQPLCDGSHTGSGKGPVKFVLTEARTVVLCDCKHTATRPFCDGSHSRGVGDLAKE